MSARAFLTGLAFSLPLLSQAATINTTADLTSDYLVTNAGKVVGVPAKVAVKLDYETKLGSLEVTDWTSRQICQVWGESPNGEPELAECEQWATAWAPKLVMANVTNEVSWQIADMKGSAKNSDTVDLSRCVRDYEKLEVVQPSKPTQGLPTLVLQKDCLGYTYLGKEFRGNSSTFGGAETRVELKFGNFLRFDLPSDLVITGGNVDRATQLQVQGSIELDPSWTQLIFDPILYRQGQPIRLFNYPAVVYFR